MLTASIIPPSSTIASCSGSRETLTSEAELHVLRAASTAAFATRRRAVNCAGGICQSALSGARADGAGLFPPRRGSVVVAAIHNVFASFAQTGSASRLAMVSFRGAHIPSADASGRRNPLGRGQLHRHPPRKLTNPRLCRLLTLMCKSRRETMLDASGRPQKRVRKLPRSEWQVLIPDPSSGLHRLADL